MGTVGIGYKNLISSGVLSGGSWDPALAYMQTRELMEYARASSTSAAHTQFDLDSLGDEVAQVFALFAHSITNPTDQIRITRGTAVGLSDVLDTGWLNCWHYTPLDDDYNGSWFPIMVVVNHATTARYTRVELAVSALPRIARPFIGRLFRPEYNPVYGKIEDGWQDQNSVVNLSQQGADFVIARREIRTLQVEFPVMTPADEDLWKEIQRTTGPTGEYVWIPSVESRLEQQRSGFLARLSKLSGRGHPHYGFRNSGALFVERGGAP